MHKWAGCVHIFDTRVHIENSLNRHHVCLGHQCNQQKKSATCNIFDDSISTYIFDDSISTYIFVIVTTE